MRRYRVRFPAMLEIIVEAESPGEAILEMMKGNHYGARRETTIVAARVERHITSFEVEVEPVNAEVVQIGAPATMTPAPPARDEIGPTSDPNDPIY